VQLPFRERFIWRNARFARRHPDEGVHLTRRE
jgi:hypothetical protein